MESIDRLRGDAPTRIELKVDDNHILCQCRPAPYPHMRPVHGNNIYRAMRDDIDVWEEITEASIENVRSGEYLNLIQELPPGYNVYRNVETSSHESGAEFVAREKAIRLDGSLEAPESFFYLAQAVGQAVADANDPDLCAASKSPLYLLTASNKKVRDDRYAVQAKGWEYVRKKLNPFLSDDPSAIYNTEQILGSIDRVLKQQKDTIHKESPHSFLETKARVRGALVLLVTNILSDAQPRPPTYEEIMSKRV